MGSSEWGYFAPYQVDVGRALEQLRQEVFESGRYYREEVDESEPEPTYEQIVDLAGDLSDMSPEHQVVFLQGLLEDNREAYTRARIPVTDIDSLLTAQADSGTHSIIDISSGISATPRNDTAFPIDPDELMVHFGTLEPSRQQVEVWLSEGQGSGVARNTAVYFMLYEDGRPSEIFFEGASGD